MYSNRKNELDEEDMEKARDDERERLIEPGPDNADEDDDFFLKGPSAKKSVRFATDKMKSVQAQISGVTDVMRDNVGRLLERGDQLDQLNARSDHLASTADSFRSSSTRLRRDAWWQNTKGKLCFAGIGFVLLLIIFVPIIVKYKSA